MKRELAYGTWPSALSAAAVATGVLRLSELRATAGGATADGATAGGLAWLESRPTESGRTVLVEQTPKGNRDITPVPFNVRSRVHEYGGGAWLPGRDQALAYFINFTDQNLYAANRDGTIAPITRGDDTVRFADLCLDAERDRLIAVAELHTEQGEAQNVLVGIALPRTDPVTGIAANTEPSGSQGDNVSIVHQGHDFYSSPRLSPNGRLLAFVVWDHPNMPWDGSQLMLAELDANGRPGQATNLAGGAEESVLQPVWLADGSLLFLSDRSGFWNLYRYDESGVYCVLEDEADYGKPPWVFGLSEIAVVGDKHVLVCRHDAHAEELNSAGTPPVLTSSRWQPLLVDTQSCFATPLPFDEGWQSVDAMCPAEAGTVALIVGYADRGDEIVKVTLNDHRVTAVHVPEGTGGRLPRDGVSLPSPVRFPTRDGAHAYGFYHAPENPAALGPTNELPPLLVMSHGGPTATASTGLDLRIQYYTSRGWAVFNVNYRGSTGYGREYHRALQGNWGILDVTDCEDGVRALVAAGLIDANRVAIRGGSAGGYTTLAALTTSPIFRSGASHYGIGDLHALARDTHKFESRYLDGLVGDPSAFSERSPINHVDRLSCPVIFFQGGKDEVVPPNQAQAMVDALIQKRIPVAHLVFPEEGHGFRDAANIVSALEAEFTFFSRVFQIPAPELTELEIENL